MVSKPPADQSAAKRVVRSGPDSSSEQINRTGNRSYWKVACVALSLIAVAFSATAPIYKVVAHFSRINGGTPSPLVQGLDGTLYGTTEAGGPHDSGTFFKLGVGGVTVLYNFCSLTNCSDGLAPVGGLVLASDGNFYGNTAIGGPQEGGTIFKVTPAGVLTTISNLCTQDGCPNGQGPMSSLIQASDGNLYGTTTSGGANGGGTVFKVTSQGALSALYSFCLPTTCPEGNQPAGSVVQGPDGNFYGTTGFGGSPGWGTAFKITPTGVLTTLHVFCVTTCADGATPSSGLTLGSDGYFYGVTDAGGNGYGNGGAGVVFKLAPDGTFTTIYTFCSPDCSTGENPVAALVQGTDGNFYGTTPAGGTSNLGTIFSINASGALTILHTFTSKFSGESPAANMVQATNGAFFGTAPAGNGGIIFGLSVGLGPFVETVEASGKAGQTIGILGQGFKGTTAVSFNGTPATYVVSSSTYLKAKIPAGASSGFITVTTPGGTLTSNRAFVILL